MRVSAPMSDRLMRTARPSLGARSRGMLPLQATRRNDMRTKEFYESREDMDRKGAPEQAVDMLVEGIYTLLVSLSVSSRVRAGPSRPLSLIEPVHSHLNYVDVELE
jgi:hypothetical protein